MVGPLDQRENDVGVIFVAPMSEHDPRVPTADELSLSSKIARSLAVRLNQKPGWLRHPGFSISGTRQVNISGGQAIVPGYPGVLQINTSVTIPAIADSSQSLLRTDRLYIVTFVSEVGEIQDPILGQYTFDYTEDGEEVATTTKENTRRMRAFWVVVWSATEIGVANFLNALPSTDILTINDTSGIGFQLGDYRVYGRDPNLGAYGYKIFRDSVNMLELVAVRRAQRHNNLGYIHGPTGEAGLNTQFNLVLTGPSAQDEDLESLHLRRVREIFSGSAGGGKGFDYAVQNLSASPNGGNPNFPGVGAGAPNGTACIANGQRVSFSNQAIIEKRTAIRIDAATDNGFGRALITVSLNSPIQGSFFSANRLDHRIYSQDGVEQSERGTFRQLGSPNALVWEGDANSTILPGQRVYCSPGIFYPAGSGFPIPFRQILNWWRNSIQLSAGNLRDAASNDLAEYAEPVGNGTYIGVLGSERAALHYILKKVLVTSNSAGILVIPDDARGNFAFIQGRPGRIDRPIVTGVAPNTTFNALVYEAPAPVDVWQFMMLVPDYQGTGEVSWINGATIVSRPLCFIHTQGGGGSVFQGDAETRLSPIAMHLPVVSGGVPAFRLNAPVQLAGEPYPGPVTLRQLPLISGSGLALPMPGQVLSAQVAQNPQPRSLSMRLLANGQMIGFRSPILQNNAEFQMVVSFVAQQANGDRRIVVMARNTRGGENCVADSDQGTAIDLFRT